MYQKQYDRILIQIVGNGYIVGYVGSTEDREIFKVDESNNMLEYVKRLVEKTARLEGMPKQHEPTPETEIPT